MLNGPSETYEDEKTFRKAVEKEAEASGKLLSTIYWMSCPGWISTMGSGIAMGVGIGVGGIGVAESVGVGGTGVAKGVGMTVGGTGV